jgi:hypothetical protein
MRTRWNKAWRRSRPGHKTGHPSLVQEEAGFQVGISADLPDAASHAASIMAGKYRRWLDRDRFTGWGR